MTALLGDVTFFQRFSDAKDGNWHVMPWACLLAGGLQQHPEPVVVGRGITHRCCAQEGSTYLHKYLPICDTSLPPCIYCNLLDIYAEICKVSADDSNQQLPTITNQQHKQNTVIDVSQLVLASPSVTSPFPSFGTRVGMTVRLQIYGLFLIVPHDPF